MRPTVCSSRRSPGRAAIAACAGSMLAASAAAEINLELRVSSTQVFVGEEFLVSLYAVSDDPGSDQLLGAIEAVLRWPADSVRLVALEGGGTPLSFEGFPLLGSSGLNEANPPQDGDALYVALAPLGDPVVATPAGVLITTIRFEALAPDADADLEIAASGGTPPIETTVFSGVIPNLDVTGTLSGVSVLVQPPPCGPADLAKPYGELNFFDVSAFLSAYGASDPSADFAPPSGVFNFFDVAAFLAIYNLGCP